MIKNGFIFTLNDSVEPMPNLSSSADVASVSGFSPSGKGAALMRPKRQNKSTPVHSPRDSIVVLRMKQHFSDVSDIWEVKSALVKFGRLRVRNDGIITNKS